MKTYCTNCKEIKPASFRKFIYTTHPAEYEDLCCDECDMILATVEDRDVGTGERLEVIFYQDENGTRWVYSDDANASIGAPDSSDSILGKCVLYVPYAQQGVSETAVLNNIT